MLAALVGTKVCAQCLEKPGTSVPGRPGLGLSPHILTLSEFPRRDQAVRSSLPGCSLTWSCG